MNLKTFAPVVLALLVSSTAWAGTYLEEVSTFATAGQSQSVTMKTWVEGDQVRTDDPRSNMTLLINTRKNSIMGVHPQDKTWWKLKDSDVHEFGAQTLIAYGIKKGPDGKM